MWTVAASYYIKDGVLRGDGNWQAVSYYFPQERPDLPYQIAKLEEANDAEIVRFAHHWGMLGYRETLLERRERASIELPGEVSSKSPDRLPLGDPVEWIRREASGLKLCSSLIPALEDLNDREIRRASDHFFGLERQAGSFWTWDNLFRSHFYRKESTFIHEAVNRALDENPSDSARLLIEFLASEYVPGLTPMLQVERTPRLTFRFDSLIQLAYFHLLHTGMTPLNVCEECGCPFPRSHGLQRFCPPGPGETDSRCGYRARYRRFKKGRQTGGKES